MGDQIHFSGSGRISYEESGEAKEITYIVFVPHKSQKKIKRALEDGFDLGEIEMDSKDRNIVYVLRDGVPKEEFSAAEEAVEDLFERDQMMKKALTLQIEFINNLEEKLKKENLEVIEEIPGF